MLKIERLICGMLESNCYVIYHEDGGQCYVIDPGYGARAISDVIRAHSLKPKAILLTHHHYDHVGAVKKLRDEFPCPRKTPLWFRNASTSVDFPAST